MNARRGDDKKSTESSTLVVQGLRRSFGSVRAVDDVSFEVGAGEITGVIGPNGSGKTTMLNLLAGHLKADAGTISLGGRDITNLGAAQRARVGIAKAAQVAQPFGKLSLIDNVAVGLAYGNDNGRVRLAAARDGARKILRDVGIGEDLSRPPSGLSIQHLKRLELARLLAARPSLALFDEIFAGIEARTGESLIDDIASLARGGLPVVLVEHRVDLLFRVADRVLVLDRGCLVADGSPREVLSNRRVIEAYFGARFAERLADGRQLHDE